MEEQAIVSKSFVEMELEEDIIPNEESQTNNGGLGDVVPCEYVAIEQQEEGSYDMSGSTVDGLYNEVDSYVTNVPTEQMVDIAPHAVENSGDELEEVDIPNEQNVSTVNELDDVA